MHKLQLASNLCIIFLVNLNRWYNFSFNTAPQGVYLSLDLNFIFPPFSSHAVLTQKCRPKAMFDI